MTTQHSVKNRSKNRTTNDQEEGDGQFGGMQMLALNKKPYREFSEVLAVQNTHFYFSEPIGEPSEYVDVIHRLHTATENDTIYIHLNTPGGDLATGVQLVGAMQNTCAHVITILEGIAYSLGTLIFLAGDELVINDHGMMMFHNFSSGLRGKGNEMASELNATIEWFASIASDFYLPFLTEDELSRIMRGEDMWMQAAEIRTRLDNMIAIRTKEAEDAAAELLTATQ